MELTVKEIIEAVGGALLQGSLTQRIRGVSTDSRTLTSGELFIPLKGERFDGHHFINDTLARGASAVMVSKDFHPLELPPSTRDIPLIQVEDTLHALGDLASFWVRRNRATIVAITGSNGKTTTREMTATILEQSYRVLKPEHNWNNLIGVPLTLLRLESHHQIAVIEMGMNRRGEIKRLSQIAQPHIGLITNIGPVHLQHLKTLENVAEAKGELFDSLTAQDYAVLNANDPLIMKLSTRCPARTFTFGINAHAQVTAPNLSPSDYSTHCFTLQVEGKSIPLRLTIPGIHTVYNALAAASIATICKLPLEEIKAGLEHFTAFTGRMVITTIDNNIHIINDTYNANPVSMESALRTLAQVKGEGNGIAVLGDMLELGDASLAYHHQLGSLVGTLHLDSLFLMGISAEAVAQGARATGVSEKAIYIGSTPEEVAEQLAKKVTRGDWILFKGSRGMKMEKILEYFLHLLNHDPAPSSPMATFTSRCCL